MEEKKTGLWKALTNKINTFLHNKELKEKLYVIIFESDTPKGKLFDVFLIGFIIMSVLVVILESVVTFSDHFRLALLGVVSRIPDAIPIRIIYQPRSIFARIEEIEIGFPIHHRHRAQHFVLTVQ